MNRIKDLVGRRFGRLTVLEFAGTDKYHNALWFCRCDCGNELNMSAHNLSCGQTRSCGCLRKEVVIKLNKELKTTHGMSKDRLYSVWKQMVRRSSVPLYHHYKYYGGRGITCDEDWKCFKNFKRDMGSSYVEGLTLERINNDEGYSKDNCRWATMAEQGVNRRNNINITHNGITQTLSRWAVYYGINYATLLCRLKRGVGAPELFTAGYYSECRSKI